jgi:hypothetical protein
MAFPMTNIMIAKSKNKDLKSTDIPGQDIPGKFIPKGDEKIKL